MDFRFMHLCRYNLKIIKVKVIKVNVDVIEER